MKLFARFRNLDRGWVTSKLIVDTNFATVLGSIQAFFVGPNDRIWQNLHNLEAFFGSVKKYWSCCSIDAEMEDLREFYDPDTVDLMQWIQQNTQQVHASSV